jgi:TonB family protein
MTTKNLILMIIAIGIGIDATSQELESNDNKNIYEKSTCFSKEEIQEIVFNIIINEMGFDSNIVTLNADLKNDLGLDSYDESNLNKKIKQFLFIDVPYFSTVSMFVDYIFDEYANAIAIYSEPDFDGNWTCVLDDENSTLVDWISSIIIPKGNIVKLFSESFFEGDVLIIDASKNKVEISDMSNITENINISISNAQTNWDDKVRSIRITNVEKMEKRRQLNQEQSSNLPISSVTDADYENIVVLDDFSDNTDEDPEPVVFDIVEQPVFPGGDYALMTFISNNTMYPDSAKANGIQGNVFIKFVINTSGKVTDVVVLKGVNPWLDEEAIRVVKSFPDWIPGKQKGEPVPVSLTVPINFKLY